MADPLTPAEMADERERQAYEARQIASQYLQSPAGFVGPPPADVPPPSPGPSPKTPSTLDRATKIADIAARGASALTPGGLAREGVRLAAGPGTPAPVGPEYGPAPGSGGSVPEQGPGPGPDPNAPLLLGPGMGQRQIAKAGMYPYSLKGAVHEGRPVPVEAQAAYGVGTEHQIEAARMQRDADVQFYDQTAHAQQLRMQATSDAAVRHQAVQAERAQQVKAKLADIEALNKEAGAKIDPWGDRSSLSRVLSIIGVLGGGVAAAFGKAYGTGTGENVAMKAFESSVNREIQMQVQNRRLKGEEATRKEHLYDLHLAALHDKDAAIDATRLGLWDNVMQQVETYKAQHASAMSEAAYNQMVGGILEKRGELVNRMYLQGVDDKNREYEEKYRAAQFAGTGAKFDSPDHIITIPASDKTGEQAKHVAVPKEVYDRLAKIQGASTALIGYNEEAISARRELREAASAEGIKKYGAQGALERANTLRNRLTDLQRQRVALEQKAQEEGVTREPEFKRALETGVNYTQGLWGRDTVLGGDTDKAIQYNSSLMQKAADSHLRGATGQVVHPAYQVDAMGRRVPQWLYTGEVYAGRPVAPEKK